MESSTLQYIYYACVQKAMRFVAVDLMLTVFRSNFRIAFDIGILSMAPKLCPGAKVLFGFNGNGRLESTPVILVVFVLFFTIIIYHGLLWALDSRWHSIWQSV